MGARRARWGVTLRIARRSALRSWGRSLLIMALIAVPVAGLAAGALVLQSKQPTTSERLTNELGRSQAMLQVVADPNTGLVQSPTDPNDWLTKDGGDGGVTHGVSPVSVLPPGTRTLAIGSAPAVYKTPTGVGSIQAVTGESWDASLHGRYDLLSGRGPRSDSEIAVSPAALTRLGAKLGDTVQMVQPAAHALHIVGIETDRQQPSDTQTVFTTSALLTDRTNTPDSFTYYVPSAHVTWAEVQTLNASGITALSRAVVLNPPPVPQRIADERLSGSGIISLIVVGTMGLAFAVLEVALLAGAAFAVGARLQQRMLATIASVGGDRAVLVRVITASGVVLGAAGGVLGLALGTIIGAVFMRVTDDGASTRYPGFHLPPLYYAAILLFAVLVGWISSLVPARSASKLDVVRALRGARTPQKVGRKRPIVGLILLIAGIVASLAGSTVLLSLVHAPNGGSPLMITLAAVLLGGGPLTAQVGALLCTGLLLRGIARLAARAPLSTRLAVRDSSRNLGRTVPAVAALMTTVFLAVFVMCIANAISLANARNHDWQAALGEVTSQVQAPQGLEPTDAVNARWIATMRRDLPIGTLAALRTPFEDPGTHPSSKVADAQPQLPQVDNSCTEAQEAVDSDPHCGRFSSAVFGSSNTPTIGSIDGLAVLLGHPISDAARAALAAGGAVALRSDVVDDGRVTFRWFTPKQLASDGDPSTMKPVRTTALAAVTDLPSVRLQDSLYITTATAKALHMTTVPGNVVSTLTKPPTDAQIDAANADLGAIANQPDATYMVTVERGPQDVGSTFAWGALLVCLLVAISAGATAVGLARVDSRADDVTFAGLGAPPQVRRRIAFVQGGVICGLGGLIGAGLGLVPAAAVGIASTSLAFSPPWAQILLTVIGIPAVIAAGSWLFVRGRLDAGRRPAIG